MTEVASEVAARPAEEPEMRSQAEYLGELRARRRELGQARPGEARALGLAIGYLQVATPARTAWLLREVLEAERSRPGEFWAESCRALRRILRELGQVVP